MSNRRFSRRAMLQSLVALGGVASLAGFRQPARASTMPILPDGIGGGRSVAIIGAGVAGLTAAYLLANKGFQVVVFEADNRYGGRSLTVRPSDRDYRQWWFDRYNPSQLFPDMYVSSYREDPARSPVPEEQTCRFEDTRWDAGSATGPVELFFNAGPGRIPSNHYRVIDLCQEIGVEMEPYIFLSESNLLQSSTFDNGQPIPFRQVNYSLMGQLAEAVAQFVIDGHALGQIGADQRDQVLNMLQQLGNLQSDYTFVANPQLGYAVQPGGWGDAGVVKPLVQMTDILDSGFIGGGDPEFSPGSFLFNSNQIFWQPTLMQPVGGMDRIWQQLLLSPISGAAMTEYSTQNLDRSTDGPLFVGDLVHLNHHVTAIEQTDDTGIRVSVRADDTAPEVTQRFDYCICTMAPNLLARLPTTLPESFVAALRQVPQTPAIKVGFQGKTRFWEEEDQIYGGISWTDHLIGQIWYPSEDFTKHTGVLTGAYNRGNPAQTYGQFDQATRINTALEGGERLHPGYINKVYADAGLSIAWQHMPNQVGGWPGDTAGQFPDIYRTITSQPQGRLYLAGDAYSYLPGWQEGSIGAVYQAVSALAYNLSVGSLEPVQ